MVHGPRPTLLVPGSFLGPISAKIWLFVLYLYCTVLYSIIIISVKNQGLAGPHPPSAASYSFTPPSTHPCPCPAQRRHRRDKNASLSVTCLKFHSAPSLPRLILVALSCADSDSDSDCSLALATSNMPPPKHEISSFGTHRLPHIIVGLFV
jgi:hypothetical protein